MGGAGTTQGLDRKTATRAEAGEGGDDVRSFETRRVDIAGPPRNVA